MWAARSDSRILDQPKYRLRAGWRRPKISPHSQRFTGTSRKALGLCHLHNHLHNQTKNMIQIENCNTALMISVKTNPADINWKAIDLRLSFLICRADLDYLAGIDELCGIVFNIWRTEPDNHDWALGFQRIRMKPGWNSLHIWHKLLSTKI